MLGAARAALAEWIEEGVETRVVPERAPSDALREPGALQHTLHPTTAQPVAAPPPSTPHKDLMLAYGAAPVQRGVRFAQPGDGRRSVAVAGEFNQWSSTATPLRWDPSLSAYQAVVEIPPGRYQYRLVIDGHWHADPYNERRQLNDYRELNSVLVVPEEQDAHDSAV